MERKLAKISMLSVFGSDAKVNILDADGVVIFTMGFTDGRHKLAQLLPFMGADDTLQFEGSCIPMVPPSRLTSQRHPEAVKSGANPDFVVTSASRNEREMRLTMDKLKRKADKLDKRLAVVDNMLATRTVKDVDVIGDDDTAPIVVEKVDPKEKEVASE